MTLVGWAVADSERQAEKSHGSNLPNTFIIRVLFWFSNGKLNQQPLGIWLFYANLPLSLTNRPPDGVNHCF
jgi:hypothetical protein